MIISAEALRPALASWVRGQERTLEALRRALAIVYRDHPGARSLEDICLSLLLAVAHRHESSVDGALHRLDDAVVRLLEDVQALRGGAESRPAALREADLRAVTEALDEMVRFEDRVRYLLDHQSTELGDGLRTTLDAATPAARTLPTVLESRRRGTEILASGEQVLAAYAAGHTVERVPVAVRAHPLLEEQMQRLRRALAAYRRGSSQNPRTVRDAVERLRRAVAEASETLRSFGGESRFPVRVTGEHVPTRPDPAAARGSIDARTLAVGRALAGRAEATAGWLFRALTVDHPSVRAEGLVGEPLARTLAGVGLEQYVAGPDQIRRWATNPPWLSSRLAGLLTSGGHPWERAHLIGPGFGAELLLGIMLAPRGVNQVAQNRGIEQFLRYAAATVGQDVRVAAEVHGRRLAVPLVGGVFEHVDVMESVHYRVPVPERPPLTYDIHVEPDGRWRVTHNLPEGAITIPLRGRE